MKYSKSIGLFIGNFDAQAKAITAYLDLVFSFIISIIMGYIYT